MFLLESNGNVTLNNDFNLTRTTSTVNYSVEIDSGTVIIGGTGWNGEITLPTVNVSTFSVSSGSVNVVIDVGTTSELNFSAPVKITIGGMAGKSAGWSRGSATLTAISTECNSATAPTNIDSTTTRECFIDSGSDLVIWTYHFTSFGAYTPTASEEEAESAGNGGAAAYATYTLTGEQLLAGYTKEFAVKGGVKFTIDGESHSVKVAQIGSNNAVLTIASTPVDVTFLIGEEKKFDLNVDGNYDLLVKLNSINSADKTISITIKRISEAVPAGEAAPAAPGEEVAKGVTPEEAAAFVGTTTLIILIAVVVLLIVIYLVYKRKNAHYY